VVRKIRAATAALIVAGVGACSSRASNGAFPSPQTTPSTETHQGSTEPIAFSDLWRRRDDLAGKEVSVRGKVVFELECPPPGGQAECTATGYLASPETDVFLASEERRALLLRERDASVQCPAVTQLGLVCEGWRHDAEYVVNGLVKRDAGVFVIDVEERQAA
jgi:hypothetical protein